MLPINIDEYHITIIATLLKKSEIKITQEDIQETHDEISERYSGMKYPDVIESLIKDMNNN